MANYKSYNEDKTKKICFSCREMLDLKSNFRLREKKTGRGKGKFYNSVCRKCEQQLVDSYRETDLGIAAEIVRRVKYVAKKKKLPFDLDREWVLEKLNSNNWTCELTGLPITKQKDDKQFNLNSLSIDKIVPQNGYVKSNVRFIINQVNLFKSVGTDEQMYALAEALIRNKK